MGLKGGENGDWVRVWGYGVVIWLWFGIRFRVYG